MKTICFCGLIQKSQEKWYISLPPKRVRVNYNPEPRIPLSHRVFRALPSAGRRAPITCQPPFELWVIGSSEYLPPVILYSVTICSRVIRTTYNIAPTRRKGQSCLTLWPHRVTHRVTPQSHVQLWTVTHQAPVKEETELDPILGLFMLIMLGHLSNGLWTLCLVPMETTIEG